MKIIIQLPIILSLFLLITTNLLAQAPDTLWARIFGGSNSSEEGYSVQQTTDGGYIIAGEDLLLKTDTNGDTLWTKSFDGLCFSAQQTTDGGYIVIGFDNDVADVWLIKTDAHGDTLWTKTFDGLRRGWGNSVQQTTDGDYIITGRTNSLGYFTGDIWLIKTDANGDTLWTKTFGGSGVDFGNSVQQTTDGGYIVTGSTASFGAGDSDVWLIKTDGNGDTLWTKTFGGSGNDRGSSVDTTSDAGYIIAGDIESFGAGDSDVWLIKADADGDTMWIKTFGGKNVDGGGSVRQTTDGGYIITGWTESFGVGGADVWLIKTDAYGDTLWTKTIGGNSNDLGRSVQQTADGGYIITGWTESFRTSHRDIWLIKIAPDVTSVDENPQTLIKNYQLHQNYPNPFNPSTTIEFTLPKSEFVDLKVFNLLGKEVATLVLKKLNQGNHTYQFDGKNLASGIYYYQVVAGDYKKVKKMILLK
jgi:hypothetical protein